MEIRDLIQSELEYQQRQLKLIPSENYVSKAVMDAVGSVLLNKYAEGQAGKRYYHGNANIDTIERTCKEQALSLFGLNGTDWSVNVQAVTGSIANLAVYNAVLEPGDPILSMYLPHGGHLSHGWKLPNGDPVSFTSTIYDPSFYQVSPDTNEFDYDEIENQAREVTPKLIISGGTSYPRAIDFKRLASIAHSVGALYMADVAHESGLIAGGSYPSPFPHADIVTMTTRKTLRGPIGALVFAKDPEIADSINRAVFPGLQGGPAVNAIAGIAVALEEASTPQFKDYATQVVNNASALARELASRDFTVLTEGTDSHLVVLDITDVQPDGFIAAEMLELADVIVNKNTIPQRNGAATFKNSPSPWRPHGLRIGTPAVTTRGMTEEEMTIIAELMHKTLNLYTFKENAKAEEIRSKIGKLSELHAITDAVHELTGSFPIYD